MRPPPLNTPMKELSASLRFQFTAIYGTASKSLKVYVPSVQQQEEILSCSVHAIAHVVQFCFTGYPELESQTRTWDFDEELMRHHLYDCIVKGVFSLFPTKAVPEVCMVNDIFDIVIDCPCGLASIPGDTQVQCHRCARCFHPQCCPEKDLNVSPFFCSDDCKDKRPRKRPTKLSLSR